MPTSTCAGMLGAVISSATPRATGARPLRADAQLNRDRILSAAAELFAERGLSVPLEEIAHRAGVGVATLYRRFPTRADLAAAAFERNISRYTEAVDRALADPRAWDGFEGLVFELCELQAGDAGLRDLLTTAFPASSAVEQRTNEAVEKVRVLIARAQAEGSAAVGRGGGGRRGDVAGQRRRAPRHRRIGAGCVAPVRGADGRRVSGRAGDAACRRRRPSSSCAARSRC